MRKIRVNAYQVGLVFRKGVYRYMLKEGVYWLWPWEQVIVCEVTEQFYSAVELNILLQDEALANALIVIDVLDTEIVLVYKNDLLEKVLPAGRYAFWKSNVVKYEFLKAEISKAEITENLPRATLNHRLLAAFVRSYSVESYEKALLFVDGKYEKQLESGVYYWWKNSIPVFIAKADMRQLQAEINGQEILTKDKAALRVNAFAQYKVVNIEKAILENKEYDRQWYVHLQFALREYIGTMTLDELLEKKETIAPFILKAVVENAAVLGVEVIGFGIRDIILPGDVKDIMNQVLIAEKKAQSNSIMRREETASTRSLLNTAKLMEDNAMLFKLKEMEYVEKIAEKINNISVGGNGVLEQMKQLFVPR